MSVETLLADLDPEQRKAATAGFNAVVTAGAGSGKTKVLASRYAWLVMEKGFTVDEILSLTFTNKAVNEMYSRIYALLAEQRDNRRAREAVNEFHKAHILTLDSFSAAVARTASSRYGISPDFTSDTSGVRELAMEAAPPSSWPTGTTRPCRSSWRIGRSGPWRKNSLPEPYWTTAPSAAPWTAIFFYSISVKKYCTNGAEKLLKRPI